MDAVVRMYEDRLKELTPGSKNITYDIQDLFRYLDNITDISALVYVKNYPPVNYTIAYRIKGLYTYLLEKYSKLTP